MFKIFNVKKNLTRLIPFLVHSSELHSVELLIIYNVNDRNNLSNLYLFIFLTIILDFSYILSCVSSSVINGYILSWSHIYEISKSITRITYK